MQKTYKYPIEIPAHIAARLQFLASRYGCSQKTIMLAGIIDAVEMGNRGLGNYQTQDEFNFKIALIEGEYCPKTEQNRGKQDGK